MRSHRRALEREAVAVLEESETLTEKIRPLLKGQGSVTQGAVVAHLAAIWIAGHVVPGDPAATRELHANMLEVHRRTVADLVEHYKARRV